MCMLPLDSRQLFPFIFSMRPPVMLGRKGRILYASPWIFAAAVGILLLIVIFFAFNNMRRERQLVRENLFNRAQAVARMVGAGTRSAMMMGAGTAQVQHLIEQAGEEPDIRYLLIVDEGNKILAHSDPTRIGETVDERLPRLPAEGARSIFRVVEAADGQGRIFELTSGFRPRTMRGQGMMRGMMGRGMAPPPEPVAPAARFIVVGLDMGAEEAIIRQGIYHILFVSLALFLAGLGGWTALLGAQGFRTSRQTLNYMRIFTGRLISRLPLGVIATADPASPTDSGRIKTFNPAAAALLGLESAAVLNRRPQEALPAPFADLLSAAAEPDGVNPADPAAVHERELTCQAADGRSLTLQLTGLTIDDPEQGVIGRVLLFQDLSERKNLEQERRKHERLLALGKMAAGVAHEVRNPLSSIKGLAALLGAKFAPASPEQEAAGLLVSQVERLNRAISELLDYARPLPLQRRPLDLNELLADSLKLMAAEAKALGITLDYEHNATLPTISADPDRLGQVLLNLYLNGFQAMPEGGELRVRAEPAGNGREVTITVSDNGQGIEPELLGQVFDPYVTGKADGVGLGLAMAYKIIDEHGGKITISSQVGAGATVVITLPC